MEEHHRQAHVLGILLAVDQADARGAATFDLVLKARSGAVLEEAVLAGPDAEELLQDVQAVAHRCRARERSEVAAALLGPPMEGQPRKRMVRQLDERIGLVVAQNDVEARLFGFDQALFEQQRLGLAGGHRDADVAHLGHQRHGLGGEPGRAEIRRDTGLQAARLADVEDFAILADHLVDAGPGRQRGQKPLGVECHSVVVICGLAAVSRCCRV